jgi:hypothetical protein
MEVSGDMTVELNCLRIRSERALILWAVDAFELPPAKLPYTDYTADFTCDSIAARVTDTRIFYTVQLKHAGFASFTVRRLLFGSRGWSKRLGYPLVHDYGISVYFGT